MPIRRPVILIWTCFLARLGFYALMLPLWEGYDEWAHFSVIRTMAVRGDLLVARDQPLPRDVGTSLELAPVPWALRDLPSPAATQDLYWTLTPEARRQRSEAFQAMPAGWSRENSPVRLTAYEALQPPVYYWMMAPVIRLMHQRSLAAQVLTLRWLSILLASLLVPIGYGIGRRALGDERLALLVAAVIALMPGLALDVARVSNDCLAVVLFSLLIWLALGPRPGIAQGLVLGLGLLTKAYFLVAVPALVVWLAYVYRGSKGRFRRVATPLLIAALIAGWWYWRNLLTTGTLSGLSEAALLRDVGVLTVVRRAWSLPWGQAVDAILFSHLYFGGWSSLMVRSWMYHLFYVMITIAAVGLWRAARVPAMWWLLTIYGAFWAGQVHNVLLLYLSKGLPASMGWYFYAVVGAEVTLAVAGLARFHPRAAASGVVLFGLLDLYTVNWVAIPYYTGMIRHKANGAIAALHHADVEAVGLREAASRLTVFKGQWLVEPVVWLMWLAYLSATLLVCFVALRRNDESFR